MAGVLAETFSVHKSSQFDVPANRNRHERKSSAKGSLGKHTGAQLENDANLLGSKQQKSSAKKVLVSQNQEKVVSQKSETKHRKSERKISPKREILVSHRREGSQSPTKDKLVSSTRTRSSIADKNGDLYSHRTQSYGQRPESVPVYSNYGDVKRRLAFDEEDEKQFVEELDFTDKLAALRSLIGAKRVESDRKQEPGFKRPDKEFKSSQYGQGQRPVSRERPRSELNGVTKHGREKKVERIYSRRSARGENEKGSKTCDDERLPIDIYALRERLEERRRQKRDVVGDGVSKQRVPEVSSHRTVQGRCGDNVDRPGCRSVQGSDNTDNRNSNSNLKKVNGERYSGNRNDGILGRLEHKETQTRAGAQELLLNRSIQSNAPFFEPGSSLRLEGSVVEKPKFGVDCYGNSNHGHMGGIESGTHIREPGMPSRDGSPSGRVKRQSNVGSFVGNLTPEKDNVKLQARKDKVKKEFKENIPAEDKAQDALNDSTERDIKRYLDVKSYRHDSGNKRVKKSTSDAEDSVSAKLKRISRLLDLDDNDDEDEITAQKRKQDDTVQPVHRVTSSKSESKVREWIEKQDRLESVKPADDGPMTIDELSSSPSQDAKVSSPSLGDSCDRIPVKLEKGEPERVPAYNGIHVNGAVGKLQGYGAGVKMAPPVGVISSLEQNRLELEFPVRDVPVSVAMRRARDSAESGADSASSIFSLPFSVRSTESVSTTVQAVKLLRKLYNVNPDTRQDLVLLAKCFRRWINNVSRMKAYSCHITEASQCSPISYGVLLRKAEIFYRTCMVSRYLTLWKQAMSRLSRQQAVVTLHRRHTLQKGMNAFKWAINRSKLQQGILKDRVDSMLLHSNFFKWRTKTEENRRCRLQVAFLRWRQFTKEAQNPNKAETAKNAIQRIRLLRTQTDRRLKHRVFLDWCDRFETRLKENKAESHFSQVLVSQGWTSWRLYTMVSKEKKERQKLAVELYEVNLQKKMFTCMQIEFVKYTKAKRCHRSSQLRQVLYDWLEGSRISHAEREADLRVAREYWARATVRAHFTAWRDGLLTRRAVQMSSRVITKHGFSLWKTRWQRRIQRREDIESYIRQRAMLRALKLWHYTVMVMKKRRAVAVECIQSALQRHVIQTWQRYTLYQRQLRRRLELHLRKQDLLKQRQCLAHWLVRYQDRCDLRQAQQLWSNTCARKAVVKWRRVCHKRSLQRLLVETEPVRQLNSQRVMFERWIMALSHINDEKKEAAEVRSVLQLSIIQKCFHKWHLATLQLLTIKPLVIRYRMNLISSCFCNWQQYVAHKAECRKSQALFQRVQLRNNFSAWRRQYLVVQLEKSFTKKLLQTRVRQCVHAWRAVIDRKHAATQFYEKQRVRSAFYYWNSCAIQQLRRKHMEKVELETTMSILREYFDRWRERMLTQQNEEEIILSFLEQQRTNHRLRHCFHFWRRHFRGTLVARENEKIRTRRLAKQALQDWHSYTRSSMRDAVQRFAAAIGLNKDSGNHDDREEMDAHKQAADTGDSLELNLFEPMNFDLDTPSSFFQSPRLASSYGTPLKRLFSPSLSRQSLGQSLELDSTSLISSSFLDARFEMEQAVKTESRREIVVTVVTRLRHWPISILFDQWKEYTARQTELKRLATQMKEIHERLVQQSFFRMWVKSHTGLHLAKLHKDQVLMRKAVLTLYEYRQVRKQKKELSALATQRYASKVYRQVFPMWLAKAQVKHRREHILHLWGNLTPDEQTLIPRERSFRYHLNRKSLGLCFSKWSLQYQQINRLKQAYHRILLEKYFGAWSVWALERHTRREKSKEFQEKRIKSLVFKTWCLRHKQKTEVARRYEDTWHNYLGVIVQSWHTWAKAHHSRNTLGEVVRRRVNADTVTTTFMEWRLLTEQHIEIRRWYQTRLTIRSLQGWRAVVLWQRELRQKVAGFQHCSYTRLAKNAFRVWHVRYIERLQEHREHEQIVQRRTLQMARLWRQKAQTTRGKRLHTQIQQQHVKCYFERWREAYGRVLDREDVLQTYVSEKNRHLVTDYLDRWHSALLEVQAQRLFNMKLVSAFLYNWRITARVCKERRLVMQTVQEKKEKTSIQHYFIYWSSVTKVRQSIRGHANLRLQLSAFKAWLLYTRRKRSLQRLETKFTRLSRHRALQKYWYMMKSRFEYCVVLTETARKVEEEKNQKLMRQALGVWSERLKRVIAGECYRHLLARRVARHWKTFVRHKRDERQHEQELMERASKHCDRKLAHLVFSAWFDEVLIVRQKKRHKARLLVKYWHQWKLRVDMVYTAQCVYKENLYKTVWQRWHLAFIKRRVVQKVVSFERRQSLAMVFVSWRNLIMKKRRLRKSSMIPLPVSPALSMPSSGSTGSSTPTEELSASSPTPVTTPRASQIPGPGQPGNKGTQASGGRNRGRSVFTVSHTGRNTPTGNGGKGAGYGGNYGKR